MQPLKIVINVNCKTIHNRLVKRQANPWSAVLSLLFIIYLPPSTSTVGSHADVLRLVTRFLGGLIYGDRISSEAQEKAY